MGTCGPCQIPKQRSELHCPFQTKKCENLRNLYSIYLHKQSETKKIRKFCDMFVPCRPHNSLRYRAKTTGPVNWQLFHYMHFTMARRRSSQPVQRVQLFWRVKTVFLRSFHLSQISLRMFSLSVTESFKLIHGYIETGWWWSLLHNVIKLYFIPLCFQAIPTYIFILVEFRFWIFYFYISNLRFL